MEKMLLERKLFSVVFRFAVAGASVLLMIIIMAPPASAVPFCTMTSDAAKAACDHEAKDDYWIAQGKCINLAERVDREACKAAAEAIKREDALLCKEQLAARKEVCGLLGQDRYDPPVSPNDFVNPDDIGGTVAPNPYFPLVAGTIRTYVGGGETVTVTVTDLTKVIAGVTCRVVLDVVTNASGQVIEDTEDWFAQDFLGNVWYFGEIVQDFENNELVSIDGTWKAGVDSAKIGIIMKSPPMAGETYRQEFSLGNAEDVATVLSVTATETVPAASCTGTCVQTKDFTPIDPGAVEHKYFAPNVGLILEVAVDETGIPIPGTRVQLISVVAP